MMTCDRARELMQEHLEGLLLPLDRASVEAHLERCAGCRAEVATWRSLTGALDDIPEAEVPADFAASVMAELPEMLPAEEGPGHVLRWGIAVAAVLSGFIAALALLINESGPEVARQTLQPLAASLHLGGVILVQAATAVALGIDAMSQTMASTGLGAKAAFVVAFAAINAALLAVLVRLRPAEDPSRRRGD